MSDNYGNSSGYIKGAGEVATLNGNDNFATSPHLGAIAAMRSAGKLTLADEAHLVRSDLALLSDACLATRRIIAPVAAEQVAHYEAAKARA
jgi:hypothetical protein